MLRALQSRGWPSRPSFWVELFAIGNIGFLAVDVAVAHAVNAFEHPAEFIPVVFSMACPPLLLLAMLLGGAEPSLRRRPKEGVSRRRAGLSWGIGVLVGGASLIVGVAGLIYHLRGDFFEAMTLKNLVYTAPFAAPLAYAGLGFLVLLNRMVDARSRDWAEWVVLLAAGGWAGNFVLSLADHAQNGFYFSSEWASVVASAIAFSFLCAVLSVPDNRPLRRAAVGVMVVQLVVGAAGSYFHVVANLGRPTASVWNSFLFGAPAFAPLLFDDLAILGLLGLWGLAANAATTSEG
ncbi:hypothetical protein [Paludisphaera mucosa]|uniref:Uncharacterized protein n=1 Tax=Paludisphaera mucosa TaxID=3030827 RepID=A0ABT6FFP1_9BACT|nr:hypothetical protein [Paludisphaera mucosa]MDG3006347.1 hypothetical protein [Paludisphaera mucosa]